MSDVTGEDVRDIISAELSRLGAAVEVVTYPKGSILWQIGDPADFVGLIVHGEVALKKALPMYGKPIILEMLWDRDFLGECVFRDEGRRETLAEAMQPCQLAILRRATLERLKEDDPQSLNGLLQTILLSVSRRLTRMSNRLTRLF